MSEINSHSSIRAIYETNGTAVKTKGSDQASYQPLDKQLCGNSSIILDNFMSEKDLLHIRSRQFQL